MIGTLIFHDDLRQWFELKLEKPVCGADSIELVRGEKTWKPLQMLRGCHVMSSGKIDIPFTGYYSLNIYQDVSLIRPTGACAQQKPFPDYSRLRPPVAIRKYHVDMRLHYQTDGPLEVRVTSENRTLKPWQVYASYYLTGGFAYYAYCGKGFEAANPAGTPEGKPWQIDGYIAFDPESVPKGVDPIKLEYDCTRIRR